MVGILFARMIETKADGGGENRNGKQRAQQAHIEIMNWLIMFIGLSDDGHRE